MTAGVFTSEECAKSWHTTVFVNGEIPLTMHGNLTLVEALAEAAIHGHAIHPEEIVDITRKAPVLP